MKKNLIILVIILCFGDSFAQKVYFGDLLADTTGITYKLYPKERTAEVVSIAMPTALSSLVMGPMSYAIANKVNENKIYKSFEGVVFIPSCIEHGGITFVVKSIGNNAFADNDKIFSIIISDSVTTIGEYAFSDCKNLTNVFLPKHVKSIGTRAFAVCKNLTDIMLPEECDYIGDYAFGWSGLKHITIGKINNSGKNIFHKCKLDSVLYPKDCGLPQITIPSTSSTQFVAYERTNSPYTQRAHQLALIYNKNDKVSGETSNTKQRNNNKQEVINKEENIPAFVSDVDTEIPQTTIPNKNTFVLIIANENYQSVAPVPYALNDGKIFRQYCEKTLGIPSKNIRELKDATGNQIKLQINWLRNVVEVFDNPSVIFYYAGHGIPDETSKVAYLLPVDGAETDVTTGYKLDDLYATLGNMPASRVTIFMDACFSGSKREEGMLASARGVALKAKPGVPQGNMVVFSAAQGDEAAYPNREQQHGLFTYFLLKKIQETQGDVSLKDLGDYVIKQVSQQSLLLNNKKQTPCVTPSSVVADSWQSWKLK